MAEYMELNAGVLTKSNKDGIKRVKEAKGGMRLAHECNTIYNLNE